MTVAVAGASEHFAVRRERHQRLGQAHDAAFDLRQVDVLPFAGAAGDAAAPRRPAAPRSAATANRLWCRTGRAGARSGHPVEMVEAGEGGALAAEAGIEGGVAR
jgi:hypothetical protein